VTVEEFFFRVFLTGLLAVIIEVADAYLLGDLIAWWLSLLLSVILVFGGWLIWVDLEDY